LRWSVAGIVAHCSITAAPRHRRMCSSISVAVRPLIFSLGYSAARPSCERMILSRFPASLSSFCANERKLCSSRRRSLISLGTAALSACFAQSAAFERNLSALNIRRLLEADRRANSIHPHFVRDRVPCLTWGPPGWIAVVSSEIGGLNILYSKGAPIVPAVRGHIRLSFE